MQPAGPADDLRYTELYRQTGGVSLPALPFFAGLWYTVAYPTRWRCKHMKHDKKKILIALAVLLVILAAALAGVGNYMVNFAIVRSQEHRDVSPASIVTEENKSAISENRAAIDAQKRAWLSMTKVEKTQITSADGLTLVGQIYWNREPGHKWLLGIHGYTGKKEDAENVASFFAQQGYNVLLPDMRAHGESEGTYIGMGWLDRKDVLLWIDAIVSLDPEAQIILHGTSMGAATVMMAAGETLPANVRGIIEDCGYTSVWDIFADELSYLFGLPTFPVLNVSSLVAQVRAGYSFKEASALRQLEKATVPILFIHGSEDNFVRTDMVYTLYDACPTEKELLVVEGAGHGEAYAMDPELYFDTVFGFIERVCIPE